ncbi:MAG: Class A beta-lactamase [Pseudolabrys sp.]|jgi:beta-lactamase class A|nr:Class A beta-lactamase [Pseudolabrys sp.]
MTVNRRDFVSGAAGTIVLAFCERADATGDKLAALEKTARGRLGVTILDTATGRRLTYRGAERFALLSTWKVLATACVLARVDRGEERLDRKIGYVQADILSYAPVTKLHVPDGMTIGDLCAAAVELSDNTAGNLILQSCDGPAGLTKWLRSIGDGVTRLDRTEPALNEAKPGDPRDTTTPEAMAQTLSKLLTGTVLSPASRQQLADWMIAGKTGGARLRAGLPAGWKVGDKTGTNDTGCANDVAVAWPPQRAPLIIASYLADSRATPQQRDAVHAEVARIAAAWRS